MRFLTHPMRRLLGAFGYRLVKARPRPAPTPTPFDTPTDAIYARFDVVFQVPLSRCHFSCLFSYGPEGWNPFVETLLEYGSGRHTRYHGSILNRYYEAFQPRTTLEVFLGLRGDGEAYATSPVQRFTLDTYFPVLPWQPRVYKLRGEMGLDASHGSQAYGPVSEAKGRLEFSRLTRTYDSIRRHGYRPTGAPDADILGYFLRHGGDYRFVVRAGFHRMAALAALKHDPVRVRFFPHYPRVIDLADVESWPQVKAGNMDAGTAEAIFLSFFGDGGVSKARELRLA
jgi:hypothetical protein